MSVSLSIFCKGNFEHTCFLAVALREKYTKESEEKNPKRSHYSETGERVKNKKIA